MKRMAGFALLTVVVLLLFGLGASGALGSAASRVFQGTEWLYMVGAGAGVMGLDLLFASGTRIA